MSAKEIVKRLKDSLDYEFDLSFNDRKELLSYIEQLQTTAKDCKQKLDQYENPDDLTLFYMWLDEKAKDKIKQLEKENEFLKLDNPSANMKHFEMLKENKRKIDNLRYQNKQLKNKCESLLEDRKQLRDLVDGYEILKLLKGDSDE